MSPPTRCRFRRGPLDGAVRDVTLRDGMAIFYELEDGRLVEYPGRGATAPVAVAHSYRAGPATLGSIIRDALRGALGFPRALDFMMSVPMDEDRPVTYG
jgi:hypothetical protein